MEKQAVRIVFALFLIALGVVFLLSNMNVLPFEINNNQAFWSVAFAVGGMAFMAAFLSNPHETWWAAIPGFTLLGLAGVVALPSMWNEWGGVLFLGMIGMSFLLIYLIRREFWWAIIPGGALVTLALVALATTSVDNEGTLGGAILFLGLAATFLVIYFLPTADGRMQWAIWPAGVLGILGVLLLAGAGGLAGYIFPLILLGAGGLLIFRAVRR
jgi:hypothetical protein